MYVHETAPAGDVNPGRCAPGTSNAVAGDATSVRAERADSLPGACCRVRRRHAPAGTPPTHRTRSLSRCASPWSRSCTRLEWMCSSMVSVQPPDLPALLCSQVSCRQLAMEENCHPIRHHQISPSSMQAMCMRMSGPRRFSTTQSTPADLCTSQLGYVNPAEVTSLQERVYQLRHGPMH